ncbi:MAG: sugar ABC transporter ATP-binding protein [Luteolibacter sp.]
MSKPPLLEMRGICKRFPGVVALDNVCLTVGEGEVLSLCGENGAGKSTLMKILGGVYQPEEGELLVDGKPVKINNVTDAMDLGIGFIHQELNVLENLDIAANVFLGREPLMTPFKLINRKKIHADTVPLLKRLGLDLPTHKRLGELPIAQQQMVEIAKALSLNARILIMDEPTSSLTLTETDCLLNLIAELRKQGVSIIYISHRLGEVDRCSDRVEVLRDGKNAGGLTRAEINHDNIVSKMVGREIKSVYTPSGAKVTRDFLKVRNAKSSRFPNQQVSFDASRGEILGFAGLVGAGRSEIVKAVCGLDPDGGAEVRLGNESLVIRKASDAIGHGIFLVPENRREEGLVTAMSVRENTTLPSLRTYSTAGLIQKSSETKVANEQIASLRIKTPHAETLVRNLSGGNQQKVVIGKWLAMGPKVLILDEPTRGIDVGAKAEIYKLMRELAANGAVILMISSDMEEVLHVSDRVAVMHEGRITGILDREDCNEKNVMQLAVGRPAPVSKPAFS